MKKIGLIFDSNYKIGGGHFWRCYNLAKSLKNKELNFFFISNNLNKNFKKINKKEKFNYLKLSQIKNFNKIKKIIEEKKLDIVISDFYDLSSKNKKKIRDIVDTLIVIDDHLHKKHNCDVFINNNFMDSVSKSKIKKLNPNTNLFLGQKFFIHNHKFLKLKKKNKNRKKIKEIFAFFGSSDPSNETFKFIKAINKFHNLNFKILIGKLNKNYLRIKSYCKNKKNIKIFFNETNYSTLKIMHNADFSFGSGGINLTERLFLGIPSVAICTASNQRDALEALKKKKIIHHLGTSASTNTSLIRNCMNKYLYNKNLYFKLLNKTQKYYKKDIYINLLPEKLNMIINKIKN